VPGRKAHSLAEPIARPTLELRIKKPPAQRPAREIEGYVSRQLS
jgi:hypothetical protein